MTAEPDAPPVERLHQWPMKSKHESKCGCCDLRIHVGDQCFLMTDGTVWAFVHARHTPIAAGTTTRQNDRTNQEGTP